MPGFSEGDRVKVKSHPKESYIGLEGTISGITETWGTRTQPLTPSGKLPLAKEQHYAIKLDSGDFLLELREDWLELVTPN